MDCVIKSPEMLAALPICVGRVLREWDLRLAHRLDKQRLGQAQRFEESIAVLAAGIAHDLSKRGGRLVASFPVDQSDEILLVTDAGQLIRCPVGEIRIAGRNTSGVTIFRTADDEHVVSVERLAGEGGDAWRAVREDRSREDPYTEVDSECGSRGSASSPRWPQTVPAD